MNLPATAQSDNPSLAALPSVFSWAQHGDLGSARSLGTHVLARSPRARTPRQPLPGPARPAGHRDRARAPVSCHPVPRARLEAPDEPGLGDALDGDLLRHGPVLRAERLPHRINSAPLTRLRGPRSPQALLSPPRLS